MGCPLPPLVFKQLFSTTKLQPPVPILALRLYSRVVRLSISAAPSQRNIFIYLFIIFIIIIY
jgi:hypothetical protein